MSQELVVLIPQRDEVNHSFLVVDKSLIESKCRYELYDRNGQQGDEDEHGNDDVESITIHDGHNWKSYTINDDYAPFTDFRELNDRDSEDILAQLEDAEWSDYERGVSTAETIAYTFDKSQWAGSFGIKVIAK